MLSKTNKITNCCFFWRSSWSTCWHFKHLAPPRLPFPLLLILLRLGGLVAVALLSAVDEAETLQLGDVLVLHGLLHHQASQEDHVTIIIVSKGIIFILVVMTMYCNAFFATMGTSGSSIKAVGGVGAFYAQMNSISNSLMLSTYPFQRTLICGWEPFMLKWTQSVFL